MKTFVALATLVGLAIPAAGFAETPAERKAHNAQLEQQLKQRSESNRQANDRYKAEEHARAEQIRALRSSGGDRAQLAKLEAEQHAAAKARGQQAKAASLEEHKLHSEMARR